MNTVITPYSIELSDGSTKTGYTITYKDNFDNEISVEEYYGNTAEEWLTLNGMGGNRQPTLLYLRQSLQIAGKVSPKLDQLESYLQAILAIYAQDQGPRINWPPIPVSFEETVKEAVETLQQN